MGILLPRVRWLPLSLPSIVQRLIECVIINNLLRLYSGMLQVPQIGIHLAVFLQLATIVVLGWWQTVGGFAHYFISSHGNRSGGGETNSGDVEADEPMDSHYYSRNDWGYCTSRLHPCIRRVTHRVLKVLLLDCTNEPDMM